MLSGALPLVGMLNVCAPVVTPKLPVCATLRLTERGALGAGLAVTVNAAFVPSVTDAASAEMETSGSGSTSMVAVPKRSSNC